MKKTFLLFCLAVISSSLFAQPVINKLYDFQPGDSYMYKKLASGETIDHASIETMGTDLTWDLSSLILDPTVYTDTIISYENASWPNSFPGCSFVWKEYSGTEQYYRKNGDSLLYMGNAVWAPSYFSPNPPTIVYPGNYSPSGYLYSGFNAYLNNSSLWTFEAKYNAYGTLVLPGNINVPNTALYVSYGGPAGFGYYDYMWVRENESLPIMRIQFYNTGSSITVQYCYVLHAALTGVDETGQPAVTVSVYPNPIKDVIHISSKDDLSCIELTDISGKLLYRMENPEKEIELDAEILNAGLYFLKYQTRDGRSGVARLMK